MTDEEYLDHLGGWLGFDCDTTCNLCHIWAPHRHGDERMLAIPTFGRFAFTASLYRTPEQGRILVAEWTRRHGGDVDALLTLAGLDWAGPDPRGQRRRSHSNRTSPSDG